MTHSELAMLCWITAATLLFGSSLALATPPGLEDVGALSGGGVDRDDDALPRPFFNPEGGPYGIVNGHATTDFKAVVALVTLNGSYGASFCSGTLVSNRYVVTAGHCVEGAQEYVNYGYDLYAVVGSDLYNSTWVAYSEWNNWWAHPYYANNADGSLSNDIAVVQLKTAINSVTPMTVNDENVTSSWYSKSLTFVGFGVTGDDKNDGGVKRTTQVPVYDYDSQFIYSLDESGVNNTNLCFGDSGGAALEDTSLGWELAGVNSFVFGYYDANKGCEGGGNGATRVDRYVSWIETYTTLDKDHSGADTDTDTDTDTDVDTDTDTDVDTDTDTDVDTDTDADTDADVEPDTGWGDPERPPEGAYDVSLCSTGPASPSGLLVLVPLILPALRRRRR